MSEFPDNAFVPFTFHVTLDQVVPVSKGDGTPELTATVVGRFGNGPEAAIRMADGSVWPLANSVFVP